MEIESYIQKMLDYDDWANREALASLKNAGAPSPRSLKLFAHIIAAERLWLSRLRQDQKEIVVWPDPTLDECEAQLGDLRQSWRNYLTGPEKLSQTISYKNSKGEPWTSTVQDVLTHVIMHSAYHRGQIAADLKAAGDAPAYTDYIHCMRQGLID